MKRCIVLMAFLLSSCGDAKLVEAVQKDVVRTFLDPEGARFTETRVIAGKDVRYVCGRVNGKNAFGAFVGAKRYWGVDLEGGLASTYIVEDGSETPCEAFERTNSSEAADRAARNYEDREFKRLNRELTCATSGVCIDEHGLNNSL